MKKCSLIQCSFALVVFLICSMGALAQWDKKPYNEWSERDIQKLLSDSPWAKTQSFTANTELTGSGRAGARETFADSFQLNFRIRFFSAKPVRQALARQMELKAKGNVNEQLAAQLKSFASGEFREFVVVTVNCDSERAGAPLQEALMLLQKRTTAELKSNTYLEVGNQKIFLQEYQSPRNDGFGARFIFPRLVNNEPFITEKTSGDIRFYSEFSGPSAGRLGSAGGAGAANYTFNMRFKVSAMTFLGKQEY